MDTHRRMTLLDHIPAVAEEKIRAWLAPYPVAVRITRRRTSKMGDYRAPVKTTTHRISVNGDLSPDAFLVTLVHEVAHLMVWEKYRRKALPHGEEWKAQFRLLLGEMAGTGAFHPEINPVVVDFALGKTSYRMFNHKLERKVHELTPGISEVLLGDLPARAMFSIHNGRTFIKEEKIRTRYRCKDTGNGKYYLISRLAKVQPG